MARARTIPPVTKTETVVVEPALVALTLTEEEATGLARLLWAGVGNTTLRVLKLRETLDALRAVGFDGFGGTGQSTVVFNSYARHEGA